MEVDQAQTPAQTLPGAFRAYLGLSAALFAASALYVLLAVVISHAPHHGLPLDVYTRLPFYDLVGLVIKWPLVHDPAFFGGAWPYTYPPSGVLAFGFFALFAHLPIAHPFLGSVVAYLVLTGAGLLLLCLRFARALEARGLTQNGARTFAYGTLLLSWPILYAIHQGNIEALLWIGVAVGIWLYWQERWWSFALVIGVVGSCKIYPLIFLLLLVPLRRWKEFAGGLLACAALTVACLNFIGPTIPVAAQRVAGGIALYNHLGMSAQGVPLSSKPFDHSLHGLLHRLLSASGNVGAVELLNRWYIPGVAVVFLALYVVKIRKLPRLTQVLLLTLAAVTLPSVSFDYTLEMLYVPFAWAALEGLNQQRAGRVPPWLAPVMICFALILSPELFLSVRGVLFYGQFKAVVLLVLFAMGILYPMEGALDRICVIGRSNKRART